MSLGGRKDSLQGNAPIGSFPQIVMKITNSCTWLTSLELIWQKKTLKTGTSFKPKGWKVPAILKISVGNMVFSSISRSRHLPKQFWGWAYETKSLWVGWFPFPFISFETLRYQKKHQKDGRGVVFSFFLVINIHFKEALCCWGNHLRLFSLKEKRKTPNRK